MTDTPTEGRDRFAVRLGDDGLHRVMVQPSTSELWADVATFGVGERSGARAATIADLLDFGITLDPVDDDPGGPPVVTVPTLRTLIDETDAVDEFDVSSALWLTAQEVVTLSRLVEANPDVDGLDLVDGQLARLRDYWGPLPDGQ